MCAPEKSGRLWWHASLSFCGGGGCRDKCCLAFKKRLEYTWGWTDQLFSKPWGCVHQAVVIASGYIQQCSAWLSLPEYNWHIFSFFWNDGSPQGRFALPCRVFCVGFSWSVGDQCSNLWSVDAVISSNSEEYSLAEVYQPSAGGYPQRYWMKKRAVIVFYRQQLLQSAVVNMTTAHASKEHMQGECKTHCLQQLQGLIVTVLNNHYFPNIHIIFHFPDILLIFQLRRKRR